MLPQFWQKGARRWVGEVRFYLATATFLELLQEYLEYLLENLRNFSGGGPPNPSARQPVPDSNFQQNGVR